MFIEFTREDTKKSICVNPDYVETITEWNKDGKMVTQIALTSGEFWNLVESYTDVWSRIEPEIGG